MKTEELRTREFGGRKYTLEWAGSSKSEMMKMAKQSRKQGRRARVVRAPGSKSYLLYTT